MKIKVKENNEENYDYIFYVMELLEILGFHEMGNDITIQEFNVNPRNITFILEVDDYAYEINVTFTYDGKVANVLLYKGNDCVNFEINRDKKEIIRMFETYYVNNCLLKKTITYDGDNDIYIYEYVDYNIHKEFYIKFKLDAIKEMDDKLDKFLYESNCSLEELISFLKENYPYIQKWLIKQEEERVAKWYYIKDENVKEIDYKRETDDIVKNKVYKYN